MMTMMQGCSGWLMAAGGIVTYGSLILVGAASSSISSLGNGARRDHQRSPACARTVA